MRTLGRRPGLDQDAMGLHRVQEYSLLERWVDIEWSRFTPS